MRIAHRRAKAVLQAMGDWKPCRNCGQLTDNVIVNEVELPRGRIVAVEIIDCQRCRFLKKSGRVSSLTVTGIAAFNLTMQLINLLIPFGYRDGWFIYVMGPLFVFVVGQMLFDLTISWRWVKKQRREAEQRAREAVGWTVGCLHYRPDHNGECLNCDEPADAHDI